MCMYTSQKAVWHDHFKLRVFCLKSIILLICVCLALLHLEWPKLYGVLVILSAIVLMIPPSEGK